VRAFDRTTNVRRVGAVVVGVLAIAGCSFPSLSRAPAVRFHGEATDPVCDRASVADVRVARPADLVYAGVQVTNDALRLTIRFAPRSLDPATTGATVVLDTDLDSTTGVPSLGLGAEQPGPATTSPTLPRKSSRFDSRGARPDAGASVADDAGNGGNRTERCCAAPVDSREIARSVNGNHGVTGFSESFATRSQSTSGACSAATLIGETPTRWTAATTSSTYCVGSLRF
jgi:hypothetical protein